MANHFPQWDFQADGFGREHAPGIDLGDSNLLASPETDQ